MKKSTRVPDGSESMKPADAQAEEPDVTIVGIRWNCCSCLQLNSMMNWYNQCSAELQCLEDPSRRWLYIMFSYGHLLANKSHGWCLERMNPRIMLALRSDGRTLHRWSHIYSNGLQVIYQQHINWCHHATDTTKNRSERDSPYRNFNTGRKSTFCGVLTRQQRTTAFD